VSVEPRPVTLAQGRLSEEAEARASALLGEARRALSEGRVDEARVAASRIVEEMPAALVSVDALLLLAQTEAASGEVESATVHAERLARVLPPGDPRQSGVATLRAQALEAAGRPIEAVRVLLDLPPELATQGGIADELIRAVSARLDRDALGGILQAAPLGSPLSPPVMLAYAVRLRLAGQGEAAQRFATAALQAGATGGDAEVARAILDGGALPGEARGRIALVLPLTGSPALRELAGRIQEGVEAAISISSLADAIDLQVLDDQGDAGRAAQLVAEALEGGVDAVVGPIQDESLSAAARARPGPVPMVSPMAYELPPDAPAVYSLASVDPGAPLALAEWAAAAGFRQVVVLAPSVGPSAEEGRIFTESFQALGGSVLRSLTYDPGATFFQTQMRAVQGLRPEALVLPVPAEDVQALASQAAFYALDTLGIQLLGTSAWGDPSVRASVSTRYTDGVMTATPRVTGTEGGYERFVEAYESRFQRTLTEPAAVAVGFDAVSLVLRALESGVRGGAAVADALEEIQSFSGATGTISIQDGRVLREHEVMCVENAGLLGLPEGTRPEPVFRPYAADPETGLVPEGPGRPAGFRCTAAPLGVSR
jgi:ABC-type branched-subunit amino acid transport system substrate-binding protein